MRTRPRRGDHHPLEAQVATTGGSIDMSSVASIEADPRRWKALGVLALIQFMLVLDITVVNVALPHIDNDLHFSATGLAWVVNGYVLMAGGLLLLGGRLADILGRRKIFLIGVLLFAVASATCGAAVNPGMLVASRFVQGMGEALAAPASLGLIALLFADPRERIKALGLWGGIAGLGGTLGVVISGVLVNYVSWRWIFYINLPIAAFALLMVPRLVSESKMVLENRRLDFAGAITGTAGLIGLVYGLLQAADHPWGSTAVLVPLIGGPVLLGVALYIEARSDHPLIPLTFFQNRTRTVTNFTTLFFCLWVLRLLLPAHAVRAAGAGLLSDPERSVVPAVRYRDRARDRRRHGDHAEGRREEPARVWVLHVRGGAGADQQHHDRLALRDRHHAGDDRARARLGSEPSRRSATPRCTT